MSTDTDFSTRELTDEQLGLELISHIDVFTDYREFLAEKEGETFRLKHVDELDFSDVSFLSASFLIEADEDAIGRPTDWQSTRRARYLDTVLPEDFEITSEEAEALLTAGEDVFELPPASASKWRMKATEAYIEGPRLGVLRSAGLIEAVDTPTGHAIRWTTTERLEELVGILGGIVDA